MGPTTTTAYNARGLVKGITRSYGELVTGLTYDEDGSPLTRTRGDAAATTTRLSYDWSASAKRLARATVTRTAAPSAWTSPPDGYTTPELQQAVLSDTMYAYDRVGNPTYIADVAPPEAWPAGAKAVSRRMEYDDRYRLTKVTYDTGGDTFVDPMPPGAVASSRCSSDSAKAPARRTPWERPSSRSAPRRG